MITEFFNKDLVANAKNGKNVDQKQIEHQKTILPDPKEVPAYLTTLFGRMFKNAGDDNRKKADFIEKSIAPANIVEPSSSQLRDDAQFQKKQRSKSNYDSRPDLCPELCEDKYKTQQLDNTPQNNNQANSFLQGNSYLPEGNHSIRRHTSSMASYSPYDNTFNKPGPSNPVLLFCWP